MRKKILSSGIAAAASVACLIALAGCSTSTDTAQTATAADTEEITTEAVTSAAESTAEETTSNADGTTETTSEGDTTDTAPSEGTDASSAEALSPIENGKVASESLEVEIKGYKVVPAGTAGAENSLDPVVVFYYDVTNLSDKDIDANSAWTEVFDAYQNTGENDRNLLGTGIFVDESIPAEEGTALIKKGETKSYYKSYQLSDDTTSVTLRSHDGLGGAQLGDDIIVRVMS